MEQLLVRAILEMLGGPKDYIEKTLKDYIAKLKKEGKKILKEDYVEAQETQNKLFSVFAEIEIEFEKPEELLEFCIDAMPSSVEVVSPEQIIFTTAEMNAFINDMQAKLHDADMMIKTVKAQNSILDKNTIALLNNFVHDQLKQGPKSIEELSKTMGIEPKYLELFLKKLLEHKEVILKENKYLLK